MKRLVLPSLVLGLAACTAQLPTSETPPLAVPAGQDQAALAPGLGVGTSPVASAAPAVASAPSPPPTALAAVEPPAPAPVAGPASCPDGMQLVEGDYCTEVEHTCLEEWWDESNKKRVCERFAPTSRCLGQKVKKRYCIDTYEWPNKKGVRPEVMNAFYQAQVKCAAVGKRMCTESEWNFACEGPDMLPFPYGYERDARKCNGDHKWDGPNMKKVGKRDPAELARLWRGVPSGSQPQCVSPFGVADLPANADEVVAAESPHAKFESVNTGGPWYKGVRNQCRPKIYTHDEGFYYYYLSFRCCSAPDGAANDPRTPGQIRKGDKWDMVERLAGFDVADARQKLDLKDKGQCTCKAGDVRCHTLCGTLLGPAAVDGTDATRVLGHAKETKHAPKGAAPKKPKGKKPKK
ncbi:MAG: SUMF1/EgtB/PvdO family nonheme iron enzyme [Polyangiaceae bacterium]|nr:SUMF1/EgtB/PvdO family nonheme iron enzyme [Polyangiaceae bacterium]